MRRRWGFGKGLQVALAHILNDRLALYEAINDDLALADVRG